MAILFAFDVFKSTRKALCIKRFWLALVCLLFALAVVVPSIYPAHGVIIKPWAMLLATVCACVLCRKGNRIYVYVALICTVILTVSAITIGNVYITALALCLAACTTGKVKTALFALFTAWQAAEILSALPYLPYFEVGIGDVPDICALALVLCIAVFEVTGAITHKNS